MANLASALRTKDMLLSQPPPSTTTALPANNVGSKLLKKMGWAEGSGLGRDGGGITQPIQAKTYTKGAGIGVQGAQQTAQNLQNMGYADKARNAYRKKFEEMMDD
jgi:RNA-binding protein 5/10